MLFELHMHIYNTACGDRIHIVEAPSKEAVLKRFGDSEGFRSVHEFHGKCGNIYARLDENGKSLY